MSRPKATRAQVLKYVSTPNKAVVPYFVNDMLGTIDYPHIIGVRGYYKDTKGVPGQNDRGIYDDAIFVLTESEMWAFNANTDPSRTGHNAKVGKGMAVLQPGTYVYRIGIHGLSRPKEQQYEALVQNSQVTIKRDGATNTERGFFGINIHRGGVNSTSSEGCQTIPPDQWAEFIALVKRLTKSSIKYTLVED